MRTTLNPMIPALSAVVLAATLAACDRNDDRTVGQKLDSAVATAERKTDQAVAEVRQGVDAAGNQAAQAIDAGANKVRDASITTSINASLAADGSLSAMKIDVDTVDGRVMLKGSAPDEAARQRATELAQRADGVRSVDNQLVIKR